MCSAASIIETLEDNINEIITPKHINVLKIYQWLVKSPGMLRVFSTPDFPGKFKGIYGPGFTGLLGTSFSG
jgi:hypothetical protein